MEGNYLPVKERIKIAQKGRKSHFSLGQANEAFATTQNCFFKSFIPSVSPQTNIRNRTAPHFILNSDKKYKTSEYNANYSLNPLEPKKPKSKIVDLAPNNAAMGTQKMQFTTSNFTYSSMSPQAVQSFANSPSKNRKQSFELCTDKQIKSSIMHSEFSPIKPKTTSKIEKALLNSHAVMGSHPHTYISVASKEFSPKFEPPCSLGSQKAHDLKKDHFKLGQDKLNMVSSHQDSYKLLLLPKQGLSKEQLENLQNSHFAFKADNPDYISTNKKLFNRIPNEIHGQEKNLKTNHIIFRDDKKNYGSFRSQSVNEPVRNKIEELNHDIALGAKNSNLNSNAFYTGTSTVSGRLDLQREKNLKDNNCVLGNSLNIYEQPHKNHSAGYSEPTKYHEELKDDVASGHWIHGSRLEKINANTQRNYKPKKTEKIHIEKFIKKHKLSLGDSISSWSSTYTGNCQ